MSNIATLARDWLDAKRDEKKANLRRLDIETQLAAAIEIKSEGSATTHIEGYKITATQPVYRKVDPKTWETVKANCPMNMWPVKHKIEADAAGCKYLANNEPEVWSAIASAFETKPGKIGIKVEEDI